jgi:hypothetical protein
MRIARSWLVAGVLLAATAAGATPPPTPTRTTTWTPARTPTETSTPAPGTPTRTAPPTITGTALPTARIPVEMLQWVTPAPTPPSDPRCVYVLRSDVNLPACVPVGSVGGGGTPTPCLSETIATTASADTAESAGTLAAGATVVNCLATTMAAVPGGYDVGLHGAPLLWGTVHGAASESNALDPTRPIGVRMIEDESVVVTSRRSNGFADNDGRISLSCWCAAQGGP